MTTASYWNDSASGVIPQFDSLKNNLEVDVVIVGAGLTGITAAYLLKKEALFRTKKECTEALADVE